MNVNRSGAAFFGWTANPSSSLTQVLAMLNATFKASFVVTAQLVADPGGAPYQDVSSLFHGHVKHMHHAYRDHPGSNPVVPLLFARLFEFFPFYVVHGMRADLQTFRLFTHEFWRVAIGGDSK